MIEPKKLLVATPEYIPKDPKQRHEKASWIESLRPEDKYIGFPEKHNGLDEFFTRFKFDLPLAIEIAKITRQSQTPLTVLALREGTGLLLSYLNKLNLLGQNSEVYIYMHSISEGPLAVKSWLVKRGRWNGVICLTQKDAANFVRKYNVLSDTVHVNPFPVNVELYHPQKDLPRPVDWPFVFTAGVSHRDYHTLLKAMRLLQGSGSNIRLVVDPSSPHDHLKDHSWKKDLPTNVTIMNFSSPDSLKAALQHSQFAVVALKNIAQPSDGCTLAQTAAAMEKATVAATTGLQESIIHQQTGLLVDPQDPEILAESMQLLWDNPTLASEMGERGRRFMVTMRSPETWINNFHRIIDLGHGPKG